jgi:RNA polymerase sigma-70 factor, ECF subfamily
MQAGAMDDGSIGVLDASQVLWQFQAGGIEAFEELFRLHQRAVYGWILRIVRNAAAAEDLTVETFWRIHCARARFDPTRGFLPWARRIATHAALDYLRVKRTDSELTPGDAAALAAPARGDAAVSAEIRVEVARALGRLPPKLRVAAVLAVIEEEPHKEIADALGISVTAVKVRVFRALRILRKDLESRGITP